MLGNAKVVSLFSVLAQLFGFLRTAIMAFLFGASAVVDAYNLALVIPALLSSIISGWLQAGFVGRYMQHLQQPTTNAAEAFRSAIGQLVAVIAVLGALLIHIAHAPLAEVLVPASSVGTRRLTEVALMIASCSLVPMIISDFLGLVLNCHGRFLAAAAGPVINALVSALALWLWPEYDLNALLFTLLIGWFAQIVVMAIAYRKAGLRFVLWQQGLTKEVRSTLSLALPILPAAIFSNGTILVIQMACSRLGEGAVALYGYASRLHGALTQVLIIGISTVLLPHLAGMLAERRHQEIISLFWRIGRSTLMLYAFVLAGVISLGESGVVTVLGRGKFDLILSSEVWKVWSILTLSLYPFALATFFAKLFQASQRPVMLSLSSFLSLIITAVVCYIGVEKISLYGVVMAPLIAQLFVLALFLIEFRRKFGSSGIFPDLFFTLIMCAGVIVPPVMADIAINRYLFSSDETWAFLLRSVVFCCTFILIVRWSGAFRWISREEAK